MNCSFCGAANPSDAAFCGSCGWALEAHHYDETRNVVLPAARSAPDGATSAGATSSDATRYLCAAVQLDSTLAERVINQILEEEYKSPPSSPDVDLVPVLKHAVAARGRQLTRDAALVVLLLVLLWAYVFSPSGFLAALGLVWVVVVGEQLIATYGVVAHDLRPGRFKPRSAPQPTSLRLRRRLDEIAACADGNVTVYGAYSPFVGSGVPIDAWSFALDIQRGAEGRTVEPFTVHEIHDFVLARMRDVQLSRIVIEDRVFVDGRDLRGDSRFLPREVAAPVSHLEMSLVRSLTAEPEDPRLSQF
jgi:hypothetical protein